MAVVSLGSRAPTRRRFGAARRFVELRDGASFASFAAIGAMFAISVVAIFAPLIAPHSPTMPVGAPYTPPFHVGAILGTDQVGRDILSRVLYGLRSSWFAAVAVIAFGAIFGGTIGLIAGATGGLADSVLMRVTDGFMALPAPVLAIAIAAALGPSFAHTLIAVAIVWWPYYTRIVRGEIRAQATRPHYEAARLAGVGRVRRLTRHLLPAAVPTLLVTASNDVGALVLTLAGLSFLGLGAPAPAPELGAMCAQGLDVLLADWWIPIMPALAVFVLVLISNLSGDGVRDLLGDR